MSFEDIYYVLYQNKIDSLLSAVWFYDNWYFKSYIYLVLTSVCYLECNQNKKITQLCFMLFIAKNRLKTAIVSISNEPTRHAISINF